jgi:IS30 family transposase
VSRPEAAASAGVHLRAAADWDRGIRQIVGGRVYADGRLTMYGTTMPRVTTGRPVYIHGDRVDLAALERPLSPRFLSLHEREQIHGLQAKGASIRSIARTLGRSPSTVSRELKRNTSPRLGYLPYDAHRRAAARRPRPKQQKLLAPGPLRTFVLDGLAERWSPE